MSQQRRKKITECTFPDCGCPEARLCMAGEPSEAAIALNRPPSKLASKLKAQKKKKEK